MNFIKSIILRIISLGVILLVAQTCDFIADLFKSEKKEPVQKERKRTELEVTNAHSLYWYSNLGKFYSASLGVNPIFVRLSRSNKLNDGPESYGELYAQIYQYDRLKLNEIINSFDKIARQGNYSRFEFADIIVSAVQNIPYSLVIQEDCEQEYYNDPTVRELIDEGTNCEGYVYAGIYTPIEFIDNFEGDCDTRTLFIYTILRHYDYDVKILNSDLYGHSIIGLNIPHHGRYKYAQGKRYYTWETTSENWELGDLSPEVSDMNYWYVAL